MIDERLLDNAGPLAAANAAARRELVVRAITRDYRAGATLFRAGSVAKTLYVILSGEVRVVRATAGRLHVLHSEGAGGTLGDAPMFEPVGDPTAASGRYLATAEATRDTRCLTLTRDALASVLAADPDLAWMFLGRLATRVRDFVARLDRVTARDAKSRLGCPRLEAVPRSRTAASTPWPVGATGALRVGEWRRPVGA